jgi:hypothetical protein
MASRSDERSIEVNRALLLGGVVLISTGALLGTVGGIAMTVAAIGAARSWVRQLDEPPSAMARRRLAQARSAAVAGAQGWRQNGGASGSSALQSPDVTETSG